MWSLTSTDLPTVEIKNNTTVIGLELLELGDLEIRSPLFRFSFINREGGGGGSGENSGGGTDTPIIDEETNLTPETTSFLYRIENIWDFSSLEFVDSINKLGEGKYTHYFGETIFITNEASLAATATFFAYVPRPSSLNTYEINLLGNSIESVSSVEVEGLPFKEGASQTFVFDEATGILTLTATVCCKPKVNSVAEIFSTNTFTLSEIDKLKVYIFDLSSTGISYVTYMDYLGKSYVISSSLTSGTLINNYEENKLILLE